MRPIIIATSIAIALALVPGAATADPNEAQSGMNLTDCLDYNTLYEHPGVESPLFIRVEVEAGTGYQISSSSGTPFVDFYAEDGSWLGYNGGDASGDVPENAAYGGICVGLTGGFPDAPDLSASWTYQDGFEAA